ncbi:phage major tail tube protein [Testudinibacter sp. P27/CKL/0425]
MALPRKLKQMNLFVDGVSYHGQATEVTVPKLAMKSEAYRAGGMLGEVDIDLGVEKLEIEHKYGGIIPEIFAQFGEAKIDGVLLRFAGSYQREDTGDIEPAEVVVRGRHVEIDPGNAKVGDDTEHTVKSSLTYYKLTINGTDLVEIDMVNMVYIVNGNDRMAEHRAAIGL